MAKSGASATMVAFDDLAIHDRPTSPPTGANP